MKKKYITLEEVLALRGTDTKIYSDGLEKQYYYQFKDGLLCLMKDGNIDFLGGGVHSDKLYILEQEEFKLGNVGLWKTRDGSTAFVSCIDEYQIWGIILGDEYVTKWDLDGTFCGNKDLDLVEYVGD